MVNLSYLFSFSDFSLTDFLFGNDKKIKYNAQSKDNKNENKNKIVKKNIGNNLSEKEIKLILKLEIKIDNFLYRKKVRELIQKLKEHYKLICSANIPNLSLNLITKKKVKQYKLFFEPILNQYIVLLPRKIYRNKKKLKFNFVNSKNEIFIEPLYKTENENGSFVNIIDLRQIKEEEYKNYENFQNFLKEFRNKKKGNNEINENKNEINKLDKFNNYQTKKSHSYEDKIEINNNYFLDNKILGSKEDLKVKKIKKRKASDSILINNFKIVPEIKSILKDRNSQRIKNTRKISFQDV